MDILEKAKIRISNWIDHNEHHQEEYELFADQMEKAGKKQSAQHIMDMTVLTARSNDALRLALESLDKE